MIHYLVRIESQSKESHPRWPAPRCNAHVSAAAVAFLKLHGIVIQLLNRMDRRSGFQDSDFIVARKCEVEAEVLFHAFLTSQKKLPVPECLTIIEKARSAVPSPASP